MGSFGRRGGLFEIQSLEPLVVGLENRATHTQLRFMGLSSPDIVREADSCMTLRRGFSLVKLFGELLLGKSTRRQQSHNALNNAHNGSGGRANCVRVRRRALKRARFAFSTSLIRDGALTVAI